MDNVETLAMNTAEPASSKAMCLHGDVISLDTQEVAAQPAEVEDPETTKDANMESTVETSLPKVDASTKDAKMESLAETSLLKDAKMESAAETSLLKDAKMESASAAETSLPKGDAETSLPKDTKMESAAETSLPKDAKMESAAETSLPKDAKMESAAETSLPKDAKMESAAETSLPEVGAAVGDKGVGETSKSETGEACEEPKGIDKDVQSLIQKEVGLGGHHVKQLFWYVLVLEFIFQNPSLPLEGTDHATPRTAQRGLPQTSC